MNPVAAVLSAHAQAFLEDGLYKFPEQAAAEGAKKHSMLQLSRSIGRAGKPALYHVTDKAPDKKSPDWHRVVAVFVTGAAWQFKGWPHKVLLCHTACSWPQCSTVHLGKHT